jgi:hypothetical protein
MTKDEFSEKLAKKCELSKAQAMEIIDAIFSTKPKEGMIAECRLPISKVVRCWVHGGYRASRPS